MHRVGTAIIGCGNIASFYFSTLPQHPMLQVVGVADRDRERASRYAQYYSVHAYPALEGVLADKRVDLVINLTNPRSHFSVSRACLEAGKHVYSEKPLAMTLSDAGQLVRLAELKGLTIASAPSRILAETAQTIWKALREGTIGTVHAAYAEMDGGLIHRLQYKEWVNELDMPWPYWDEFEVGCTLEHTGYPVSWLTAYFGPVDTVTAFATCRIPDKETSVCVEVNPPDLTVACLRFRSGVVARLTTSWIAPPDHSLRIFGETGVLSTNDIWMPRCPVYVTRNRSLRIGPKSLSIPRKSLLPLVGPPRRPFPIRAARTILRPPRDIIRSLRARIRHIKKRVDFCLGPVAVAESILEARACRLPARYCLHNTEVVLAIHNATDTGASYKVETSFEPMEPMSWAAL
jgi:predicted dehydrogenase